MRITGDFRRLTPEEERELALERPRLGPEAWKTSEARRTLIECNIAWAKTLAHRHGHDRLGEENYSVAMLGLVKSVDWFDPGKGRLSSFVATVVRNEIYRAASDEGHTIHVPEEVQRIVRYMDNHRESSPRRPTLVDLVPAARMAMNVISVDGRLNRHHNTQDKVSTAFRIADESVGDPDYGVEIDEAERLAAVHRAIDALPQKISELIRLYYFSGREMTMKEIGLRVGMSKSSVGDNLDLGYEMIRSRMAVPARMAV